MGDKNEISVPEVEDATTGSTDSVADPVKTEGLKSEEIITETRQEPKLEVKAECDDTQWDCGPCFAPKFCRPFNRIEWVIVFWAIAAFAQSGFINGATNAILSPIQLRYQINNMQLGLIVAAYDAATVVVVTFTTYYGAKGRKPRWIGIGMLTLGLAALLYALPQVLFGSYQSTGSGEPTCNANVSLSCETASSGQSSFWIFLVAQLIAGAGASPLYTLGVTYIEENASPKQSSVYIGVFMTLTIIGPAVGFIVTGVILNSVYVDIYSNSSLTANSPLWVGAWWLPFLCFGGILLIFTCGPITGYPEILPKSKFHNYHLQHRASEVSASTGADKDPIDGKTIALTIVRTPTIWLVALQNACHAFRSSIFTTFGAKIIQLLFNVPAGISAILLGAVIVPGAAIGLFLGGLILKHRNLTVQKQLNLMIFSAVVTLPLILGLLLGCPSQYFAGLSYTYPEVTVFNATSTYWSPPVASPTPNLVSSCNTNCSCSPKWYSPICGSDGVVYYSPCFAGCQRYFTSGVNKVYFACSCISPPATLLPAIQSTAIYSAIGNRSSYATASLSSCPAVGSSVGCMLPLFLVLVFLIAAFSFLPSVPVVKVLMGSVPPSCSATALAFNSIVFRILGIIPSPIIGGIIFDEMCSFWQSTACFEEPSCLQYDAQSLSYWLYGVLTGVHILQIVFCVLARVLYKSVEAESESGSKPESVVVSSTSQSELDDLPQSPDSSAADEEQVPDVHFTTGF